VIWLISLDVGLVIWWVILGWGLGSSCHEEDDRIAKRDSFSRLCSTVIAADYSAGIEGEDWDEIVCFCLQGYPF